jgi:hypothetical protein
MLACRHSGLRMFPHKLIIINYIILRISFYCLLMISHVRGFHMLTNRGWSSEADQHERAIRPADNRAGREMTTPLETTGNHWNPLNFPGTCAHGRHNSCVWTRKSWVMPSGTARAKDTGGEKLRQASRQAQGSDDKQHDDLTLPLVRSGSRPLARNRGG